MQWGAPIKIAVSSLGTTAVDKDGRETTLIVVSIQQLGNYIIHEFTSFATLLQGEEERARSRRTLEENREARNIKERGVSFVGKGTQW